MSVKNNTVQVTNTVEQQISQDNSNLLFGLDITSNTTYLNQSNEETDKTRQISAGSYPSFNIDIIDSNYMGLGASTLVSGTSKLLKNCFLSNLSFISSSNGKSIIVDNSTCKLQNCIFIKEPQDKVPFIELIGSAKLILLGCKFIGGPSSGLLILNTGLIADVQAIGCINDTSLSYGNVTLIGSF